jgi:hypothetical protein
MSAPPGLRGFRDLACLYIALKKCDRVNSEIPTSFDGV